MALWGCVWIFMRLGRIFGAVPLSRYGISAGYKMFSEYSEKLLTNYARKRMIRVIE